MPFLREALTRCPNNLAVDDGGDRWSYRELAAKVDRVAADLRALGVKAGDRVALPGAPTLSTVMDFHGVWLLGGSVAPLNPRWTAEETRRALGTLCPDLVLKIGATGQLEEVSTPCKGKKGKKEGEGRERGGAEREGGERKEGEREAACLLTSGTSGKPRAVSITVGNLQASGRASQERLDLSPSDRWLAALSLAHVGGLALITRACLLGSAVVFRGPFEVGTVMTAIRDGSVTHASLVPTMLYRLLDAWDDKFVPNTLRCLLVGGAAARRSLLDTALQAGFPVALTYGLTEASSQVATADPHLVRVKPGTVGAPLSGFSVRISQNGELMVAGPTVAPEQVDPTGWLATGDLAHQDKDGHLWIQGRISDRIITGGVNVDPSEVEGVMEEHPGVRQAAVLGMADPEWGEKVVAVVVPMEGIRPSSNELRAWVRQRLSGLKVPRSVRFVAEMPNNPNGKIDRNRLRALFR